MGVETQPQLEGTSDAEIQMRHRAAKDQLLKQQQARGARLPRSR